MDRKEKTIRYKIRTGAQWLLVSLLTTSTILPGITATVSASTKETKVSQNIDASQEGPDNSSVDNKNRESLSVEENDERDTATLITSESVKTQNNNTNDNDIEKKTRESDDIASGVLGTSEWRIDSEGTLHIGGGVLESAGDFPEWGEFADQIEKITFDEKVTGGSSLKKLFSGLYAVVSIEGLSNLDTSNVTDMSEMFNAMESLVSLNTSSLITSNVTDMSHMFDGNYSLEKLDLSNFDTSNVIDMSGMFMGMGSLQELFISNFTTSKVTSMKAMFMGMDELAHLDVSNFDTSNVTDMSNMFEGAYVLADIEVSNFNTSNVNDMHSMFAQMESLQTLDLSNFNTSNVEDMSSMFAGQYSLNKLILGSSFRFVGGIEPEIEKITSQGYTGKWINVSSGTVNKPLGENIWDSDELMLNYNGTTDADTYVWQREAIPAENVVVKYNDENNNSIADEVILSGNIGDEYVSELKDIEGYTFKEVKDSNATGVFTDQAQTVTYVYNKNKEVGSVTLRYVDTFGQPIEDFMFGNGISSMTFKGEVGNSADGDLAYLDVPGWVLLSELPTGVVYSETPQTFDMVYDRAGTIYVNYEDTNGVKLKPEWRNTDYLSQFDWTTGEYPSPVAYEVSPLDIQGYEMLRVEGDAAKGDIEPYEIKHVTFVYSKPVVLNVHDSTLYVGDIWSAEDNFDSALDKDGKSVDFKDIKVMGDVDTSKAGTYEITYSYDGIESKATITVKDKQTEVKVHDSNIYVGDKWSAEDNFNSALDKDGKSVDFKDIKVSGNVDTTKAGSYEVTYSYDGLEATATVTVLKIEVGQDLAHIIVHDSELKVGDDWSPQDNFDKATSSDGKEVNFSDVVVNGAVDTKKPGIYEVTYSIPEENWGRDIVEGHHTATAKIVVTEENSDGGRDANPKEEESITDKDNSPSAKDTSRENNTQNAKGLPKTGEHTSALIFMMGIALLILGSIFSILRVKKNKK